MEIDYIRQLKIKEGIIKRISKEYQSYQREIVYDKDRIVKLKSSGADEHKIRKQEQVLAETISMMPNTTKRLKDALDHFLQFMNEINCRQELINTKEWKSAQETIFLAQEITI